MRRLVEGLEWEQGGSGRSVDRLRLRDLATLLSADGHVSGSFLIKGMNGCGVGDIMLRVYTLSYLWVCCLRLIFVGPMAVCAMQVSARG